MINLLINVYFCKNRNNYKMKKILFPLIAVCLVLAGCQKTGPDAFKGNFSFKTGGYVEISGKAKPLLKEEPLRDTSFIRHLPNESGQMHIVANKNGSMKVTMNITGGNPVVFDATATNDAITLAPVDRQMIVYPDMTTLGQDISMMLSIGGVGHRYQNMIIFDMEVKGKYNTLLIEGEISKSYVTCIATENE